MITGMYHTGFVVKDLDKAVEFYRDVVGLTAVASRERVGKSISQVVGYENTHLKIAFLNTGNGHNLELIQYVHPAGSDWPSDERNTLGAAHLAFYVDDIEQTHQGPCQSRRGEAEPTGRGGSGSQGLLPSGPGSELD